MSSSYRDLLLYSSGIKIISHDSNIRADKRLSKILRALNEKLQRGEDIFKEPLTEKVIVHDARTYEGNVPVLGLYKCGHDIMGMLQKCASAGGDFNFQDAYGDTVLSKYLKLYGQRKEVVRFILDNGTDPSLVDNRGDSALTTYLINDGSDRDIANMIVNSLPRGIPLDITMKRYISRVPHENGISVILDQGHDAKTIYSDRTSDLLRYVNNKSYPVNSKIVDIFLKRGSDPNHSDRDGYTPLMGCLVRLRRFENAPSCAKSNKELDEIVASVNLLLDYGAEVTTRSRRYGWTPLLMACTKDSNEKMIRRIIELGADVNISNHEGFTPLMRYCVLRTVDIDIVRLFLDKGADPNANNSRQGSTSFMRYVRRMKLDVEVIRLFLRMGSDANIQDNMGKDSSCILAKRLGENWRSMFSEKVDLAMCRNRLTKYHDEVSLDGFSRFIVGSSDDVFYHVCGFL